MENMIQEEYITFEQAKLLKEKGFPQESIKEFRFIKEKNGIVEGYQSDVFGLCDEIVCFPTLSLVQKWLRKEKEFDVFVTVSKTKTEYPYKWNIIVNRGYNEPGEELPHIYSTEPVSTPEQALSEGIDKALKLI